MRSREQVNQRIEMALPVKFQLIIQLNELSNQNIGNDYKNSIILCFVFHLMLMFN